MANIEAVGGVNSYVLYGKESTYNTAVAVNTHLGLVQSFKATVNPNLNKSYGFAGTTTGGRKVVKFTPGTLDIDLSTDFVATNFKFLEYILGSVSGTTTLTYVDANTLPSMTLGANIVNPGSGATNQELTYSGVLWDTCTIKCSTGEAVKVSMAGKAALGVIDTSVSTAQALPSENVFNFTGGSISLGGASVTNIIDSVELTIKNNLEMLYGLGSRLAVYGVVKQLEFSLKFTVKYLNNTLFTAAFGATTPTGTGSSTEYNNVVLTFADGARGCVFTFGVSDVSQFAQMQNLNDIITEDVEITPVSLSAAYTF